MAEVPQPQAQLGAVGIFYVVFASVWTLILACAMAFLYVRRDMPMLRIRGLPLSFGAVILLHMYWIAVQTGYIYGPIFPPAVEYWIMGVWFPLGIALFHASNSRFLYVAKAQKRFVNSKIIDDDQLSVRTYNRKTVVGLYKSLDHTNRMLVLVSAGMAFQVCSTLPSIVHLANSWAAVPYRFHVRRLPQVPPLVRYPRNRNPRHRRRAEGPDGPWMGVVAVSVLAVLLGLDRCSHHSLGVSLSQ